MISIHYSGGASNASPAASVGGAESSVSIVSQTATLLSPIAGISILGCAGLRPDDGLGSLSATLTVVKGAAGVDLIFSAYGFPAGTVNGARGNYQFATASGTFDLSCGGAYLRVSVNYGAVVAGGVSALSAADSVGNLLPAIAAYPAVDAYRCVFVRSDEAAARTVVATVTRQAIGSSISLAAATASGSPTGTDPSGLTFATSATLAIPANGSRALWISRRAETVDMAALDDSALIELEVLQ